MVRIVATGAELYKLTSLAEVYTHIERCGRTCYKSENMVTEETAIPFITGILKSGHESVTEHANVIFSMPLIPENHKIFEMRDIRGMNCSIENNPETGEEIIVVSGNMRAFLDLARTYDVHDFLHKMGLALFLLKHNGQSVFQNLQIESIQQSCFSELHNYATVHCVLDVGAYKDLTRHRLASFSIESTRYCNYSKGKFGSELTMIEPCNIDKGSEMYTLWLQAMNAIEENYMKMAALGAKGDQLRMLLPHSSKADMIMTANVSEWKHIFSLRCHIAAHPSVRLVMKKVLKELYGIWPQFFAEQYREFIEEQA